MDTFSSRIVAEITGQIWNRFIDAPHIYEAGIASDHYLFNWIIKVLVHPENSEMVTLSLKPSTAVNKIPNKTVKRKDELKSLHSWWKS